MRILITGFPTMGGSGLIATRLGIELAKVGHDVHFMFYKEPFFLKDHEYENITFHKASGPNYSLFRDIGNLYTIQAASKLVEIVRNHKIDVVHSHYAIPHVLITYLASQIHPFPTVVTTHGSDTHTLGKDPSYNETIRLAINNTTKVTSVSKFLASETESIFGLPLNSVEVIYDFVDTNEFRPQSIDKKLNIVQASNFRPVKQVPFLIEVFAKVHESFPSWELDLIGDGPELPKSRRISRRLKIQDKVNFLGVKNNIPEIFANSSILASTSEIESFGITIAEGMACGLPILAPNIGGIPEVCENGKSGLLYEPHSVDDAIDKLSKLMENKILREKMGQYGRNQILTQFSPDKIVRQYETSYYKIIENFNHNKGNTSILDPMSSKNLLTS